MTDLVRIVHHTSGVAEVILNRPDKMNVLAPVMFTALIDAGESLITNNRVRAVVLCGELNHWGDASDADLLLAEADEQSRLIGRTEQMEAVQANLERRPPVFHDPE
jgi:enoyl-CoA hydratase/carnithine racemase